jgi:hypothetical protein
MSVCYKLWLFDEFDWEYVGSLKHNVETEVLSIQPDAKCLASFDNWLVYDIDKAMPESFIGKVKCDKMLYTSDEQETPIEVNT